MDHKDNFIDSSGLKVKESVENESSQAPIKPEVCVNNCDSPWQDDAHSHFILGDLYQKKICCLLQSERSEQNTWNFTSKTATEVNEFNSDDFVREDKLIPTSNSAIETSGRSNAASLMSTSSKEMCMLLKYYGMGRPDEIEEDLPPEIYFCGPGRLFTIGDLKKGQSQRITMHVGSPRMKSLKLLLNASEAAVDGET